MGKNDTLAFILFFYNKNFFEKNPEQTFKYNQNLNNNHFL